MNRPAEVSTALAAALGLILATVLGFRDDPDLMTAVVIVIGALPGVVTWFVNMRRGDGNA